MVHVQTAHMINIYEVGSSLVATGGVVSPTPSEKQQQQLKSPAESTKDTTELSTTTNNNKNTKVPTTATETAPVNNHNGIHSPTSKEVGTYFID